MLIFMVVAFLGVTQARPDIGYNYRHLSTPQVGGLQQGSQLTQNYGQITAPNYNQYQHGQHTQDPIITKHFYGYSAPEDHESVTKQKHLVLGRAQKNYRVVFIKAPASQNAGRISAEFAPTEEKTRIYVLSQQQNELNLNDIATPAPTLPSKPEVFFIKYKTPQEAAHAQQQIQAKYDSLGGTSQVSDEGYAPVSSVIGSLGHHQHHHQQSTTGTNTNYIPPRRF